jgi:hypothetical protein
VRSALAFDQFDQSIRLARVFPNHSQIHANDEIRLRARLLEIPQSGQPM